MLWKTKVGRDSPHMGIQVCWQEDDQPGETAKKERFNAKKNQPSKATETKPKQPQSETVLSVAHWQLKWPWKKRWIIEVPMLGKGTITFALCMDNWSLRRVSKWPRNLQMEKSGSFFSNSVSSCLISCAWNQEKRCYKYYMTLNLEVVQQQIWATITGFRQ